MKSHFGWYYPFLIISLILIKGSTVFAQVLSESQVDSIAQKDMRLFQVPGLAIGIIKDGKLIYSKGFGVRSMQTQQPVTSKTLFGIASNTKAFTAAALGLLIDEGKLKWDDKVIQYIPEFKMYDDYATQEMTIRDLLCHRSGLATGAGDLMHDPDSTNFTVKEIIYNLRYIKPVYSFRSKFAYDNNLYLVAGEVIARISKMPWEDFVEQRILRPLQMDLSAASYNGCRLNTNIIDAHNKVNDTIRLVTRYTSTKDDAAGGIYSNIEDMSKWALMLMNNGKYGDGLNKQLLSEGTARQLWSPQAIIPVGNGGIYHTHFAAYGLGWFMVDVKGYKQIFHTGQDVGMVSEISMIPEIGLGIIVLTNNENNAIGAITDQITDSYLGITGIDRSAEEFTRLQAHEKKTEESKAQIWKAVYQNQSVKTADIKKYTGNYHDKWFGNVNITLRNNHLWFAAQRSPQLKGVLYPYQKDKFAIRWQNPEIDADTFVLFSNGNKKRTITLQPVVAGSGYNFSDLIFEKL
ncbi:MAG: serine hydrolase [Mucilaginibacter sp.]|nr:serine hydrolase [Mucilaginibacter sp.]